MPAGYIASLPNWDALLEEDYVKKQIVDAINVSTVFKDELKRVGPTSGRARVYTAKVGASQGTGARREDAQMPAYGAGEYQPVRVTARYNYATFKITGPAEEFGTHKAFVEFGLQILQDTKEALRLAIGRQTWGDGQGIMALINNGGGYAAGVATTTVDSAYGVLWGSLAAMTTILIKRNMLVQFGTEDNSGQGYRITSVGTTSITFSPPLQNAIADNATIIILGSSGAEVVGALAMVATASFMTSVLSLPNGIYNGIDRVLFPEFEGNVVNANAALSLPLIRATRDAIYKRTDSEMSDLMIGSTEMAADYEALLVAAQRFVPPNKLRGGYSVLEHDGLQFIKDSKAPIKALFFFDTKKIAWMQTADPHWKQDGSGIMRIIPGQDAKEALLLWYANLDCMEPRSQAVLYNITHT